MGVVFAAEDLEVGQRVAVKIIHPQLASPENRARLRREVQAARVSHPNVVSVFDMYDHEGLSFVVMELVDGESLKDRLEREGKLPVEDVVRLGRDVAAALVSLHGRGIIHRDVKPGNILVEKESGTARVCDAGLARPVDPGMTVTQTRMVVGTPAYMAPEQAIGDRLGTAVDVYSLGVVLHQCLSGEVPLTDETALSTLMRRQKHRPPRLDRLTGEVPPWLARLVRRMLDPDPAERPSAAEVLSVLERRRYRPLPSRRSLAGAAAVLVFLVLTTASVAMWRAHRVVHMVPSERAIRGLDGEGREVWSVPLGAGLHRFLQADVTGDGEDELVAATYGVPEGKSADEAPWNPGLVKVIDRRGRLVTQLDLGGVGEFEWTFPFSRKFSLNLWAEDLDGDGVSEIVVGAHHRSFYPQLLFLYWPRYHGWRCILMHPGWIDDVAGMPARGGVIRLAFSGVNNLLLKNRVVGVLEIRPEAVDGGRLQKEQSRQPIALADGPIRREPVGLHCLGYVLLGAPVQGPADLSLDGEGLKVSWPDTTVRLDRFLNPVPGPDAGRDLMAQRLRFVAGLLLQQGVHDPPSTVAGADQFAPLEQESAPLLREAPYRVLLEWSRSVWLARVGRVQEAIAGLHRALKVTPMDRLRLQLIDLLAVSGRLEEADAEVWRILGSKWLGSLDYDFEVMAHRLALQRRDRAELQHLLTTLVSGGAAPGFFPEQSRARFTAALHRRARLWWDELTPADTEALPSVYDPAAPAVTLLCRWRLGAIRPEDETAALRLVREANGFDGEGDLALAAARLGLGRPRGALQVLLPLEERLGRQAPLHLDSLQLWHLCRALHAKALLDMGDPKAARTVASALLAESRPHLLPAVIAREVLERASR